MANNTYLSSSEQYVKRSNRHWLILGIGLLIAFLSIMLLTFRGEYTRFENPEDKNIGNRPPVGGGEIIGSKINGENPPEMPDGYDPFAGGSIPPPSNDGPLPF